MAQSAAAARAAAAASLELHGFLRPGPPAPATGRAPDELAGWAVGPDGGLATRRQVTLIGDLAVITRIRAQPDWVAEVTVSADPAEPDWPARWPLLARMYSPYRPPVGLMEMPAGRGRRVPPYVLVGPERAVQVLVGWCGADLAVYAKQQARGGVAKPSPFAGAPVPVSAAGRAGAFANLVQLRVARADREQVVLRNLVVATGGAGPLAARRRMVAAGRTRVRGRVGAARRGDAKEGRDGHGMKGETERAHRPRLTTSAGIPVRSQP